MQLDTEDAANEERVLQQMRFLKHDETYAACFKTVNLDSLNTIDEADKVTYIVFFTG